MIAEIINEGHKLYFDDIAILPGAEIAYGSSMEFNGLFEICLASGECRYLTSFPGEGMFQKNLHSSAAYCNGQIFFFPGRGKYISVYSVAGGTISQIELPACDSPYYYEHIKIGQAFAYGKKVYAVGASYPYVIVIDSDTQRINYIPMGTGERAIMFRFGGCFCGDSFFIPSTASGIILRIDLKEDRVEPYFPGNGFKGAWAMAYDGEKFWIAPFYKEDPIRIWTPADGKICECVNFPVGYQPGDNPFIRCVFMKGDIWMWPWTANMVLRIDLKTQKIEEKPCGIDFSREWQTGCFFVKNNCFYLKKKQKEHTWYDQQGEDYIFNLEKWRLEKKSFLFTQGSKGFLHAVWNDRKERLENGGRETMFFSLEDYLLLVQSQDKTPCIATEGRKNAGAEIYRIAVEKGEAENGG